MNQSNQGIRSARTDPYQVIRSTFDPASKTWKPQALFTVPNRQKAQALVDRLEAERCLTNNETVAFYVQKAAN